ncbi:MAG: alpha/beta hydrolase [Crocinitomicaceae bacterium]|nr:alpha/beta hydrolase [Crocinitomicaceae bacterium]
MQAVKTKVKLILLLAILINVKVYAQMNYKPDILGGDFLQTTLHFPADYEGEVTATLCKKIAAKETKSAVLYIHGFNDYFFQTEMAEKYNQNGYNFYALDLRKYGRSWLPNQKLNNVRDLTEYHAEITESLKIMQAEGNSHIVLMGHSTGGLIVSLYAADHQSNSMFHALVLNSPFFEINLNNFILKNVVPNFVRKGEKKPNKPLNAGLTAGYGESLHSDYHGEWSYDLNWKPNKPPKVNYGWIRAIRLGQLKLQAGLNIQQPILVLHSDKSVYSRKWIPEIHNGDSVLSVEDMQKYASSLHGDVQTAEIKNGMHDLILSEKSVRETAYSVIFEWLQKKK